MKRDELEKLYINNLRIFIFALIESPVNNELINKAALEKMTKLIMKKEIK